MPELLQMERGTRIGIDYPYPIVELKQAVQKARSHFSDLRKNPTFREASRTVFEKHGSRKAHTQKPAKKITNYRHYFPQLLRYYRLPIYKRITSF